MHSEGYSTWSVCVCQLTLQCTQDIPSASAGHEKGLNLAFSLNASFRNYEAAIFLLSMRIIPTRGHVVSLLQVECHFDSY